MAGLVVVLVLYTIVQHVWAEDPAITAFRSYLRVKTVHPSPDYWPTANHILHLGKKIGLEAQVLEFVEGKPTVLLTWYGSDRSLSSIQLNSHMDVVPVEASKWMYEPFSAEKDSEGNIYARGSQDMKCVGLQYLEAIMRLKSSGFQPLRTFHVTFVPDEEIGGEDGAGALVKSQQFKNMNVGLLFDEGLASPAPDYRAFYAERSVWWLVIKAWGPPGHGSKHFDNSAVENLYKSLEIIQRYRASQFDLVKAGLKAEGEVISLNTAFLKAGTPTPTGFVMNLQPSEASAGFDIRIPPTADTANLEKRIAEEWAPASRNMTYSFIHKVLPVDQNGLPAMTAIDDSNPWWALFTKAVEKAGGSLATPEIFLAATDARFQRYLGIPAIGFSPMRNTPVLLHDHNEFLNEKEYLKGVEVYEEIIRTLGYFKGTDVLEKHTEL